MRGKAVARRFDLLSELARLQAQVAELQYQEKQLTETVAQLEEMVLAKAKELAGLEERRTRADSHLDFKLQEIQRLTAARRLIETVCGKNENF